MAISPIGQASIPAESPHAGVTEAEFQKAMVEADRFCVLQSRSIIVDFDT
jgi:hypothetical protein